jgi:protocatechuate 3,4-dioxygenase beta subunit
MQQASKSHKTVGGGCDGCELMYVGMPDNISPIDTSAAWHSQEQKLHIAGTVFQSNGQTPAADVIIYYWQTDEKGYYTPREGMDPQARRHGYIRGWVKTDDDGNYSIFTIRPAPYPNSDMPAHIHLSVKEPNIADEYYIDEFVFDDDSLLTASKRATMENRGGSGILKVNASADIQYAHHNIILGYNIPDYPKN